MKNKAIGKFALACAVFMAGISVVSAQNGPIIRNYEAPGNLESTGELGCIALSEASSGDNPVALMNASAACLSKGEFDRAGELYILAMLYGRFDTQRVVDRTAHQAITVIRMNAYGGFSEEKTAALSNAVQAKLSEEDELVVICSTISSIGAPSYDPVYMRQHGLRAFIDGEKAAGPPEDFDDQSTFADLLATFVKCQSSVAPKG